MSGTIKEDPKTPSISIGMPVCNGEKYLRRALDALVAQTFLDFELVISDNASSDDTQTICQIYAEKDKRIRYFRQSANIGATQNFKYVFNEARAEYFMWAAADDFRSTDFLEVNYQFLKENPEYVASTSPNGFEDKAVSEQTLIDFKLDGDCFERFTTFFENCWISHGIFYSLIRVQALQNCEFVGRSFIAADWAIDLHLAYQGKIGRPDRGYTISGVKGISSGRNAYKAFRNSPIEIFLPFYELSKQVLRMSKDFSTGQRIKLISILIKLNLKADWDQVFSYLYVLYCKYLRSTIRRTRTGPSDRLS